MSPPCLPVCVCQHQIRRHNLETGKTYASEADKLVDCSGKLILLDKLLPKLQKGGHRLLIFSQFKIMYDTPARWSDEWCCACKRVVISVWWSDDDGWC